MPEKHSTATPSRERRRYVAEMPETAWHRGDPPRERILRRDAMVDLANALRQYLGRPGIHGERDDWAAWALEVGVNPHVTPAPDDSEWYVRRVCV
jgi:hypothetical protein